MQLKQTDVVQTVISRLSEKDIRLTPQRISVYSFLLENMTHPTVDAVFIALKEGNPSLSKTTIYNTVETLTKAGLIRTVKMGEGEVRLDGCMEKHGHFFCRNCHEIFDISLDGCHAPESLLERGFEMEEFDVRATGLCGLCRRAEDAARDKS